MSSVFDDDEPLTPSHLLYGRRITNLPHPLYEDNSCDDPTFNSEAAGQIANQAKRRVQHVYAVYWLPPEVQRFPWPENAIDWLREYQ